MAYRYTEEVRKAHNRTLRQVKKQWGRAKDWQCVLCFNPAFDWAFLWRTHDPADMEGFIPLCRPDHADYDSAQRKDSHPWTGKKRPDQSERMMGHKINLGRIASPEARANMSKAKLGNQHLLGHKHSDETRAKMSASHKARWENPDVKARESASRKAAWANPETRARIIAAQKAGWARRKGNG